MEKLKGRNYKINPQGRDDSKHDGTPRKLMNVDKMRKQGWEASTDLKDGIRRTYEWFLANKNEYKQVKI